MTQSEHRAPLAPGEIRTATVGTRTFQVMHVAGGSFAQASYRDANGWGLALKTSMDIDAAVRAYADAVEQAESDAIDALEDRVAATFISADGHLVDPGNAREDREVKPLEAIAVLRKWAELQPDHTGVIASAVNTMERKIKESL